MNLFIDSVFAMNEAVNNSLDKVNVLRGFQKEGVMHIHVLDLSVDYKLVNGEWQELPPF